MLSTLPLQYWDPTMRPEAELEQGKLFADLAKQKGVQHVVFSCFENISKYNEQLSTPLQPLYKGYVAPHFDVKGEIKEYMQRIQLPATFVQLPFLFEDFQDSVLPVKVKCTAIHAQSSRNRGDGSSSMSQVFALQMVTNPFVCR